MRKYHCFLALFFLLGLASCNNSENSIDKKSSDSNNTVIDDFHKKWKGTIGKYRVTLELSKTDSLLSGTYCYNEVGLPISLTGTIKPNGTFSLNEKDESGAVTGIFNGKFSASRELKGTWTNSKNKKTLEFVLTEEKGLDIEITYEDFKAENCFLAEKNKLNIEDEIYSWDTTCTTIDIHLLNFKCDDPLVTEQVNNFIVKEVIKNCSFENNLKYKTIDELINYVKNTEKEEDLGYELGVYCNLISTHDNMLCISIGEYSYGYGAAHPNHSGRYYNFNLSTGKLIKLNTLFKSGFLEKLTQIAKKDFLKQNNNKDQDWEMEWGDGVFEFKLNDDFTLTPKGIIFSFDPYEIACYAAGDSEVMIAYEEIKDLIYPNGLLKQFLK